MRCYLLGVPKKLKKIDHETVGELAGLSFIHLQYCTKVGKMEMCIRGFQGAIIYMREIAGHPNYSHELTKDNYGKDCAIQRSVIFKPEQHTMRLLAVIPDTKYNRKKLSGLYYAEDAPIILDKDIDKEVKEYAKKIKVEKEADKSKDELLAEQNKVIESLNKQVKQKDQIIQDKERTDNIIEQVKENTDNDAMQEIANTYREKIRAEIHKDNQELVDLIIADDPDNWEKSDDYSEIREKVESRLNEVLKEKGLELNVEHVSSSK